MKTYLINLDRRPDRLEHMTAASQAKGIELVRVSAVDGTDPAFQAANTILPQSRLGVPMGYGALACLESHRKVWRLFLDSGDPIAMVAEDDIVFGENFLPFISNDWVPEYADVVRLEAYEGLSAKFDLHAHARVAGRRIHRVRSSLFNTGLYVVRRAAAQMLLAETETDKDHVDAVMFHTNSPLFARLTTYQVIPAPAIQAAFLEDGSAQPWASSSLADEREEMGGARTAQNSAMAKIRVQLLPLAWRIKGLATGILHTRVTFR